MIIIIKYIKMSHKKFQQRLSIRDSRQSSKLQRLIKFIQQNSPVKVTHHIHTCNLHEQLQPQHKRQKQRYYQKDKQKSQQKQKQKYKEKAKAKDNKTLLNQAINTYLHKMTVSKFTNTQDIKERQLAKKSISKNISGNKYDILPSLKVVKTQETKIQRQQNSGKLKKLLEGRKYQSLLLLPKQIIGKNINLNQTQRNSAKRQQVQKKYLQSSAKREQIAKYAENLTLYKRYKQKQEFNNNEYIYSGWQITDKYIQGYQHINLY